MRVTQKVKDEMLQRFQDQYGIMKPALHYKSPFELLVAVVLSAQCTDERVNIVTAGMFPKYNRPEKMITLGVEGLLVKLPGVGRKTANVLVSILFNTPAIAVDTHVFRVSNRLHLATGTTPLEVEKGLQKAIPKEWWSRAHHWLIWHGRRVCKARKPLCDNCFLSDLCPSRGVHDTVKK